MLNNQKSDASVIQVFNSPQFGEIRTAGTSEEPLFCLSDVCSVLGLRQGDVKQRLDDGVVSTQPIIDALGREQQANFVNEDGLYDVILDSRKPQAKAFRKWVTSEVLPAIRKTGGYLATKQDDTPEEIMARALTIAQATLAKREERLKQLEAENEHKKVVIEQKEEEIVIKDKEIKALAPKCESFDKIMSSEGLVTTNMIAAFLGISAIKLNKLLCNWYIQYKQSGIYFLHVKYRGNGYTKHVPHPYIDNGVQKSREHMYWTEKGRKFVIELYNSKIAS
jgi:prophage antirepressor-like protein